jgi:hypothetical protein
MATLHIEHAVTDFASWKEAYDAFADSRKSAGVGSERIRRPVGEPNQVMIDLDFNSVGPAQGFLEFLETQVWPAGAHMSGATRAVILTDHDESPSPPRLRR